MGLLQKMCEIFENNSKKIEYFHHHRTLLVIGSQQSEGEGEKTS